MPDPEDHPAAHHGDLVEITSSVGKAAAAAWVFYGIDKDTVAMPAGMGRKVPFPNYRSSHGRKKFLPVLESKSELRVEPKTVGINVMTLLPWRKDNLSGDFVFAGESVTIKPTGKKAYLVTMDGQYRKDIATSHAEDKTGFAHRKAEEMKGFFVCRSVRRQRETTQFHPKRADRLYSRNHALPKYLRS